MSPPKIIRWSGLAAVLAGVLLLIADSVEYLGRTATTGIYVFVMGLFLLTALLFSLGLVGLYASQAETAGLLGLLGFLAAFIGTTLVAGAYWAQAFFAPAVAEITPQFLYSQQPGLLNFGFIMSFSLFAFGWLLFGVATLRARVHPRWAAVLLMVGAVLLVLPLPIASAIFDVAVAWLGFSLFIEKGEVVQPPSTSV